MRSERLRLNDIKTVGLFILNNIPPANGEDINLEIKRKTVTADDSFVCNIVINLYKKSETSIKKRNFEIKYEVSASLTAIEEGESVESVQDDAVAIVYPYIQANLAALTGIACNNSVNLPPMDSL